MKAKAFDRFENFALIVPLLGLVACLICFIHGGRSAFTDRSLLKSINQFVFLTAAHATLTYLTLATLPEARELLLASFRSKRTWVVIALTLLVALPLLKFARQAGVLTVWSTFALLLFLKALWGQHAARQMYGISCIYNRNASLNLDSSAWSKITGRLRLEKIIFQLLTALIIIREVGVLFFHLNRLLWYEALSVAMLIPVFAILYLALTCRGKQWWNKKVYLCRLLLFPLAGISPIAILSADASHSTEYLFLTVKMFRRSKTARKTLYLWCIPILWISYAFFYLIYLNAPLARSIFGNYHTWPHNSLEAIVLRAFTADYLHYFLDGVIFRMKDPLVRTHIGPLLEEDSMPISSLTRAA